MSASSQRQALPATLEGTVPELLQEDANSLQDEELPDDKTTTSQLQTLPVTLERTAPELLQTDNY